MDKILHDKAFNIAKNLKYGNQSGFASMVYKFFDKRTSPFAGSSMKKLCVIKN